MNLQRISILDACQSLSADNPTNTNSLGNKYRLKCHGKHKSSVLHEFSLIRNAKTNNLFFFSIFQPISPHKDSLLSQTDRCSWGLFLVVAGYRILSDAQNVTVTLSGLRRNTSIAASLIVLLGLLCRFFFSGLNIFYRLNLIKRVFCV